MTDTVKTPPAEMVTVFVCRQAGEVIYECGVENWVFMLDGERAAELLYGASTALREFADEVARAGEPEEGEAHEQDA